MENMPIHYLKRVLGKVFSNHWWLLVNSTSVSPELQHRSNTFYRLVRQNTRSGSRGPWLCGVKLRCGAEPIRVVEHATATNNILRPLRQQSNTEVLYSWQTINNNVDAKNQA